ncbi:hypothetical protein DEAC_c25120 [Desulfosporosinus acididurans]|uniref:Uncharacterized protein n=1 Tax=Desulfosporosinus acididurans TaxID=476652 RepID=A0A0J1FPF4_9FIRM|nr:hypothetical protein [Desulfosporosinus acididurans]KLU65375.1 hypothetical protein DEAC_c25120 [Desulfosporosinus acididurans]
MTANIILMIAAIVIGVLIVVKFIRFIVRGIVLLAVLASIIFLLLNMTQGTPAKNLTTTKLQTTVQSGLGNITQKLKTINYKQAQTNFQNALTQSIDYGKQALAKISH